MRPFICVSGQQPLRPDGGPINVAVAGAVNRTAIQSSGKLGGPLGEPIFHLIEPAAALAHRTVGRPWWIGKLVNDDGNDRFKFD